MFSTLFTIFIIWGIWSAIKAKMERDKIRDAIYQIRVNILKDPTPYSSVLENNSNPREVLEKSVIYALNEVGCNTDWIKDNTKISILFNDTIDDILSVA